MDHRKQKPPKSAGAEATLDALMLGPSSSSGLTPEEIGPRVALVEGSGPGLSGETRVLLRTRLRTAALVFCLGSLAFYVKNFLSASGVRIENQELWRAEHASTGCTFCIGSCSA